MSLIQSVTGGTKVKTFGSLDPARGDRRDVLSSREVSTFKGGVTAHVVGLDSSQLIEPKTRLISCMRDLSLSDETPKPGVSVTVKGSSVPSQEPVPTVV